ncbi:MAG: alpha-amylase, partial [Cytophaga sp.]|nr:alpha-amylase [Undibacterium sp.]
VAVGAGEHQKLSDQPYTFKRTYEKNGVSDKVVVALDLPTDKSSTIALHGVFADGQKLKDYYSGKSAVVIDGKVTFESKNAILLIGQE